MSPARTSVLILVIAAIVLAAGAFLVSGRLSRPPAHGTALLLEADTSSNQDESQRQEYLASARRALSRRMNRFGANFSIEPAGPGRLLLKAAWELFPVTSVAATLSNWPTCWKTHLRCG